MGICRRRKVRELLVRIFDFYPTDLLRGWLAAWQISASGIRKMNVFMGRGGEIPKGNVQENCK